MNDLKPTCADGVFIEEQRDGYIRYINEKGNRWEVHGICTDIGNCYEGAVNPKPELDCPVNIFFKDNCCPLKVVEIPTVIVPALSEDCLAAKALKYNRIDFQLHIMKDEFSYSELMNKLWKERHPFIIVEHDIVVYPEAIKYLSECEHPYCGCYYQIGGNLGGTLGCTKFGRKILTEIQIDFTGVPWSVIDAKIAGEFEKQGVDDFHRHFPSVTHMHNYGN